MNSGIVTPCQKKQGFNISRLVSCTNGWNVLQWNGTSFDPRRQYMLSLPEFPLLGFMFVHSSCLHFSSFIRVYHLPISNSARLRWRLEKYFQALLLWNGSDAGSEIFAIIGRQYSDCFARPDFLPFAKTGWVRLRPWITSSSSSPTSSYG